MRRFVVVGGGVAGHRAALELARGALGSHVDLLSEEPTLPYDRPPLSKEILLGSKSAEMIVLAGATAYSDNGVLFHPATRVTAIDRSRRVVTTLGGREFPYDKLLLATGSRPRLLPDALVGDAPVHYLRTLDDAVRLNAAMQGGRRVVVIGGGYIGLEVAAAAMHRGCRVTVLEAMPRLLARSMPEAVSSWVAQMHRAQGVDIRTAISLQSMRREGDGAVLSGPGWSLDADLVIAGIGIVPNVELAAGAGLALDDGVVVDAQCHTSDPEIFAAGEVTARPLQLGAPRRVESWRSSMDQGTIAAQAMLGIDVHFDEVPSLWSDQYDINIQAVGFPQLAARHEVLGDQQSGAWTWVALDAAGIVVGGIAINRGRDAAGLRRAVKQRAGLAFLLPRKAPDAARSIG